MTFKVIPLERGTHQLIELSTICTITFFISCTHEFKNNSSPCFIRPLSHRILIPFNSEVLTWEFKSNFLQLPPGEESFFWNRIEVKIYGGGYVRMWWTLRVLAWVLYYFDHDEWLGVNPSLNSHTRCCCAHNSSPSHVASLAIIVHTVCFSLLKHWEFRWLTSPARESINFLRHVESERHNERENSHQNFYY